MPAATSPEILALVQQVLAERDQAGDAPPVVLNVHATGSLAGRIDHTLLKPGAQREEVLKLCAEAVELEFASVCLNPSWVAAAAQALRGSGVMVCTVVGFPLGAMTSAAKAFETREAVANGAHEIDMVINIGALKDRDYATVANDVRAVVEAAQGRPVKVILETALLNEEEKIAGCILSKSAGAGFVKTSTGFGGGGATVEDIGLMRKTVGPVLGVKASGAVRDRETAERMIAAGATRIGTSSGRAIVGGNAPAAGVY